MEVWKAIRFPSTDTSGRETALGVVEGGEDTMKNESRMKHMDAAPRGRAFKVTVSELYQREITVYESEMKEATPEEALRMVENWWQDSQIDLNEADFQGVDYSLTGIMDAPAETEGGE